MSFDKCTPLCDSKPFKFGPESSIPPRPVRPLGGQRWELLRSWIKFTFVPELQPRCLYRSWPLSPTICVVTCTVHCFLLPTARCVSTPCFFVHGPGDGSWAVSGSGLFRPKLP